MEPGFLHCSVRAGPSVAEKKTGTKRWGVWNDGAGMAAITPAAAKNVRLGTRGVDYRIVLSPHAIPIRWHEIFAIFLIWKYSCRDTPLSGSVTKYSRLARAARIFNNSADILGR
jgi:hypothetical protein